MDDAKTIPDEWGDPIALAIGRAVVAAAALEKVLLGEIARRHVERGDAPALSDAMAALERATGGRLLLTLEKQGIDAHLAVRISDVVEARNRVVHRLLEDLQVAAAVMTGAGLDVVIADIDQIAADCKALCAELQPLAEAALDERTGMNLRQTAEWFRTVDLDQIPDPALRTEVKEARAMMELTGWPDPPGLLGHYDPSHDRARFVV